MFEQLHTDGHGAADDLTSVRVQFQAVAIAHDYGVSRLQDATNYYLTAAVEFGPDGEYIWVSQTEVTTDLVPEQVYENQVNLELAPTQINKGDSEAIIVTMYITEPAAAFEFTIKQPLGYEASFSFSFFSFFFFCFSG